MATTEYKNLTIQAEDMISWKEMMVPQKPSFRLCKYLGSKVNLDETELQASYRYSGETTQVAK
jgi:hypothetical protein